MLHECPLVRAMGTCFPGPGKLPQPTHQTMSYFSLSGWSPLPPTIEESHRDCHGAVQLGAGSKGGSGFRGLPFAFQSERNSETHHLGWRNLCLPIRVLDMPSLRGLRSMNFSKVRGATWQSDPGQMLCVSLCVSVRSCTRVDGA